MPIDKIAIAYTAPPLKEQAELLATQLQLPVVSINNENYPFLFVVTEYYLEIRPINQSTLGPIHIDYLAGKLGYRHAHTFIKNELLAKAVGIKGNQPLTVLDATAGLGRDSFILACLGCNVTMLERSPIMAALLADGLTRLLTITEYQEKLALKLLNTNALDYLLQLQEINFPDVIYLDPMYPHRSKAALVKKELRVIRELVGNDDDAEQLFLAALHRIKKRLVVKRPRLAPSLGEQKPDVIYWGKQQRFDVYFAH